MTKIFTIGSSGKTCEYFFDLLKKNKIDLLIDIRLNNKSQLLGFTKGGDDYLGYLLKELLNIKYVHDVYLAPTDEILNTYHKDGDWKEYVSSFDDLIKKRDIVKHFNDLYGEYSNVCLLCTEELPDKCHRRLVAENIATDKDTIIHL